MQKSRNSFDQSRSFNRKIQSTFGNLPRFPQEHKKSSSWFNLPRLSLQALSHIQHQRCKHIEEIKDLQKLECPYHHKTRVVYQKDGEMQTETKQPRVQNYEDIDRRIALHTVINIEESDSDSEDLAQSYFTTSFNSNERGLPVKFLRSANTHNKKV